MTSTLTQITDDAVSRAAKQIQAEGQYNLRDVVLQAVQAGMADAYERGIHTGLKSQAIRNEVRTKWTMVELLEGLDYIYPREQWGAPLRVALLKDDINEELYAAVADYFNLGEITYHKIGMGRYELRARGLT